MKKGFCSIYSVLLLSVLFSILGCKSDDAEAPAEAPSEKQLTSQELNLNTPILSRVKGGLPGYFREGENLNLTAVFSRDVVIRGEPILLIDIGGISAKGVFKKGPSNSKENTPLKNYQFSYEVESNHNGPIKVEGIDLNGGSIKDKEGNDFDDISYNEIIVKGIVIDNLPPESSRITVVEKNYKSGENIDILVNFKESIVVDMSKASTSVKPQITLNIGEEERNAIYLRTENDGDGSDLLFRYTVQDSDHDSNGIGIGSRITLNEGSIKDLAGNDAILDLKLNANANANLENIIIDHVGPTITNVTIPDGNYLANENIDISVDFNEAVDIDRRSGTPQIALMIGGHRRYAHYQSGSGTANILFRYIVSIQDSDHDGVDIADSVTLNGAIIQDQAENDASLEFMGPSHLSNVRIDAVVPSISSVDVSSGHFSAGDSIDIQVNFTENVMADTIPGIPQIPLMIGGSKKFATYQSGSGTKTLTFRYTVLANDNDSDGIAMGNRVELRNGTIRDSFGNNAILTLKDKEGKDFDDISYNEIILKGIVIDNISPESSGITVVEKNYKSGENIDILVNFKESIVVDMSKSSTRVKPQITLNIGEEERNAIYLRTENDGDGSDLLFRYTVQDSDHDSNGIGIGSRITLNEGSIKDLAGNDAILDLKLNANLENIIIDHVGPTITNVTIPDGNYLANENIDISVDFNEPVDIDRRSGTPQIALMIGGHRRYAHYQSGRGTANILFRYIVSIQDSDHDGVDIANSVTLNGAIIQDQAENDASLEFMGPSHLSNVRIDAVVPSISSVDVSGGHFSAGDSIDIQVNFTENVMADTIPGIPQIPLMIGDSKKFATYQSGSGTKTLTFRYTVLANDNDSDGIAMGNRVELRNGTIRDSFGNNAILTLIPPNNLAHILVDTMAPSISSVDIPGGTYRSGQNIDISVEFNERILIDKTGGTPRISLDIDSETRYADYQFTLENGTTLIFRYEVSHDNDSNGITMDSSISKNGATIKDSAGNNALLNFTPPGNLRDVLADTIPPSISEIRVNDGDYREGDNLDVSVLFNEEVTVDTEKGLPIIVLTIGHTTKYARYHLGSGSSTLLFRYRIGREDNSDGISMTTPVISNGGLIQDRARKRCFTIFYPSKQFKFCEYR